MKKLLLIALLSLSACKELQDKRKDALKDLPLTNISAPAVSAPAPTPVEPVVAGPTQEQMYDAILANVNAQLMVPGRENFTQPSYLPNGSYSAFNEHYCVNGNCSYVTEPNACAQASKFPGDFSVYADNSATFWDSITETVVMSFQTDGILVDNEVVVLNQTTGHQGFGFTYEYLGQKKWKVNFGASCSRIYHCHIGDCLE